jgi:4-hydroxybenzoyl-CoA reductase subunit beta
MQLPQFEYVRPQSLAEGLALLAEHGNKAGIMSGGTDMLMNMKFRLETPEYLVSLNGLEELKQIEELPNGGLRIGAGCTLTELAHNSLLSKRFPALRDSIQSVASLHVRNFGTIGGNICLDTRCWYTNQSESWRDTREGCFKTDCDLCHVIKTADKCHALNSSDTAPILMVMEASVILASAAGEREVKMLEFYQDDGIEHTVLQPGEIVIAVIIHPVTARTVYAKLAQREGLDFASGSFAAAIDGSNDNVEGVRLVMGSVGPEPKRLTDSEQILIESGLTDDAIEAATHAGRPALGEVTNLYTPSGYKRRLVRSMVRDALHQLREQ